MAAIKKELTLVDRFSGVLSKYIGGLERAVSASNDNESAIERMAATARAKINDTSAQVKQLETAFRTVYKNGELFDAAEVENSFQAFYNAASAVYELTDAQNSLDMETLLTNMSIQQLIDGGLIRLRQEAEGVANTFASDPVSYWNSALEEMSYKTLQSADSVETMDAAFRSMAGDEELLATEQGAQTLEYALQQLLAKMADVGLAWTDASQEFDTDTLLMENSLDALVKGGLLTYEKEADNAGKKTTWLSQKLQQLGASAKDAVAKFMGLKQADGPMSGLSRTLSRMVLSLFSISKLVSYVRDAIGRAPDEVMAPFEKLKNTISDLFAGPTVSAMQGMTDGINKLNAALESPAGQRFARGMEVIGNVIGQALGFVISKISELVTWLGENFQTVVIIAAVAAGILALKMFAVAAGFIATHAVAIALIGVALMLAQAFVESGGTTTEVVQWIGEAIGWLYAFAYNIVADIYNALASFAEFFANFLNDPIAAIGHLLVDLADFALGVLETIAKGIDALFGSDLASAVSGWKSSIQDWADETFGEKQITIDRMEKIDFKSTMTDFGKKAVEIGDKLSNFSLDNMAPVELKPIDDKLGGISADTRSINDSLTNEEDIKALVDMAEQQFVSQVNLTAQTPVITINGANTGNTEADRRRLANTLRDILIEQVAVGSASGGY